MPKYLTETEIRHAAERLRLSSAQRRMCEFLIGIRTLRLADKDEVAIAESVPEFIQALEELTLWASDKTVGTPYFNPFDGQAGFKSPRFPSNGPSNTMHGWATQSNSPFEILHTRPKSIKRRPVSPTQLRAFLVQGKRSDDRPRLIDAAVWFYRTTDLEGKDGSTPDRSALEAKFIEDLGLDDDDVTALFRLADEDTDEDILGGEVAEQPGTEPIGSEAAESGEQSV